MLGQLAREEQTHSSLNLAGGDGVALVVARQAASLGGDALEDVVDERVHDGHRLVGDTSIVVDLFQDLVDEGGVGRVVALVMARGLRSLLTSSLLGLLRAFLSFAFLLAARHGCSLEMRGARMRRGMFSCP